MKVNVNQAPVETSATNIASLLEQLHLPADGIAVGVNGRIVLRKEWEQFALEEDMNLMVIKAACGG